VQDETLNDWDIRVNVDGKEYNCAVTGYYEEDDDGERVAILETLSALVYNEEKDDWDEIADGFTVPGLEKAVLKKL
jgi:hypothetical protein